MVAVRGLEELFSTEGYQLPTLLEEVRSGHQYATCLVSFYFELFSLCELLLNWPGLDCFLI